MLGLRFDIFTDCKAFKDTMAKKNLNSRIANWALQLEEFYCQVHHRSGTAMRHVDALSRHPSSIFAIEHGSVKAVKNTQLKDEFCRAIKEILAKFGTYEDYHLRNDVLYKFVDGAYVLVVPKSLQKQIIQTFHERGHFGLGKVSKLIKNDFFIPQVDRKIAEVISNCIPCILAAKKNGKKESFLHPIAKMDQPLHTFHLDHLGPLPSTAKNYRYILVIVDAFCKFMWIYPVKSTTASEVINRLNLLSQVFGHPRRIVSDKGAAFTSNDFEAYCLEKNIEHHLVTTGVPRGNGQAERMNKTIIQVLTRLSIENPLKWYQFIPKVQCVINSTVSRSTGRTPFELMFGVKMASDDDVNLRQLLEDEIMVAFEEDRQQLRAKAKIQIHKIQEENRKTYNQKRKKAPSYDLGELVAIQKTQFATGQKLFPKYLGPYEIIKVSRNDRYVVKKVGEHEGPNQTSTAADYMKRWRTFDSDSEEDDDQYAEDVIPSTEAVEFQDGRMGGNPGTKVQTTTEAAKSRHERDTQLS